MKFIFNRPKDVKRMSSETKLPGHKKWETNGKERVISNYYDMKCIF